MDTTGNHLNLTALDALVLSPILVPVGSLAGGCHRVVFPSKCRIPTLAVDPSSSSLPDRSRCGLNRMDQGRHHKQWIFFRQVDYQERAGGVSHDLLVFHCLWQPTKQFSLLSVATPSVRLMSCESLLLHDFPAPIRRPVFLFVVFLLWCLIGLIQCVTLFSLQKACI